MIGKELLLGVAITALVSVESAWGLDPGLQDSMMIGNLDRSAFFVGLHDNVTIPVWLKTDDSITFVHIPLASNDNFVTARNGGVLYPPLSEWDDKSFLAVDNGSPRSGYASQSILGFAYLADPRDPQNFLMTDYQWVHIADFTMTTTANKNFMGDTTCFIQGRNRANGDLVMGLQDGITNVIPATIYTCLIFGSPSARDGKPLPTKAALYGAYPNPFNSSTIIKFALPSKTDVNISIFNVGGQKVRSFRLDDHPAGDGSVTWDATDKNGKPVASGTYMINMKAGKFQSSSEVTLVK